MRYEIAPNSNLTLPLGIRIENPTSVAIAVTIEAPEVVAARDPRSQPEMFFSQANDPNSWGRQFEAAAQRLDHEAQIRIIEPPPMPQGIAEQFAEHQRDIVRTFGIEQRLLEPMPPMVRLETAEQVLRRQCENGLTDRGEIAHLERAMQARNMEALHERQRAQLQQYQAYLERLGNAARGAGEVNPIPPPEAEQGRAHIRARKLLLEHLSSEQRSEFRQTDGFRVKGSTTDLIYRIENGGRVVRLSDCNEFCLQVVGEWVPHFDAMLARKILLECDEPQFLATANNLTTPNAAQIQRRLDAREIRAMNERNNREVEAVRRRWEEQCRLNQMGLTERMVAATARLFGAR